MDGVTYVVGQVVDRCVAKGMLDVSDTLAAMVARSVIFDNEQRFSIDKKMDNESLNDLIRITVERLQNKDSPSLETIKMQVAFDLTSAEVKEMTTKERLGESEGLAELRRIVVTAKVPSRDSFEKLTVIYRQIFSYLMFSFENLRDPDKKKSVEREVAAALESVFPRVTLKSFVAMNNEDKRAQLCELINIVLGILLFNRFVGKGGDFLLDLPVHTADTARSLTRSLEMCVRNCERQSEEYVSVLRYVRKEPAAKATDSDVDRWRRELTNRRQLGVYAGELLKDVRNSSRNIENASRTIERELMELKSIVGSQHSVPKETVYPKFDIVARNWLVLADEAREVNGMQLVWEATEPFESSFSRQISPSLLSSAAKMTLSPTARRRREQQQRSTIAEESSEGDVSSTVDGPVENARTDNGSGSSEGKVDVRDSASSSSHDNKDASGSRVTLLTDADTPEIESLPLSLRGYCPVTLVERGGLLLGGHLEYGVARFQNRFYTFESNAALHEFMNRPKYFVDGLRQIAGRQPELVGILNLESIFPDIASVKSHVQKRMRSARGVHPLLAPSAPQKKDASTGTPTHFVEKHIDYTYKWNEWDLRRETLRIANIRNSKTHSAQTDASHFREHVTTQVYLPRESGTQTRKEKGTNPPRSRNYIAGLRGSPATSKFVKGNGKGTLRNAGACVVNLTFET